MKRVTEPELMDYIEQVAAYAAGDFEEPHGRIAELFTEELPKVEVRGNILNLGCGPCDISFRFASCFPQARVIGIDGSHAMINLANK